MNRFFCRFFSTQFRGEVFIISICIALLCGGCGKKSSSVPTKQPQTAQPTAHANVAQPTEVSAPVTTATKMVEVVSQPQAPAIVAPAAPAQVSASEPVPQNLEPGTMISAMPETPPPPSDTEAVTQQAESVIVVLGYHQFDNPSPNQYSIRSSVFREQMQKIRDMGWAVIPMQNLLRFLKGEIELPPKCVVITVDDGYRSVYLKAFPILKEFGYPWTFFCYTQFVNSGAGAVTWTQLHEMQQAGCDVQSHTHSHPFLTKKGSKTDDAYDAWLSQELAGSKEILEKNLGTSVNALAYSYGAWNVRVQQKAIELGYEGLFTVAGTRIGKKASPANIGRYIITTQNEKLLAQYLQAPKSALQAAANSPATAPAVPQPSGNPPKAVVP